MIVFMMLHFPPLEIIYEDLHFVAVFFAFLTAVSAILVCFMWLCNKSVHLYQKQRRKLEGNYLWG